MNSFVINGLVKRRPELAGDIEKTHETISLDALRYSFISKEGHFPFALAANAARSRLRQFKPVFEISQR